MANLNITYAEMHDSADRMRKNKEEVDARLTECMTIVNNLTASGFVTDQASGEFHRVTTEFHDAANKLMPTLEQLSDWLTKAVDALQDMDSQLAGSLKK